MGGGVVAEKTTSPMIGNTSYTRYKKIPQVKDRRWVCQRNEQDGK